MLESRKEADAATFHGHQGREIMLSRKHHHQQKDQEGPRFTSRTHILVCPSNNTIKVGLPTITKHYCKNNCIHRPLDTRHPSFANRAQPFCRDTQLLEGLKRHAHKFHSTSFPPENQVHTSVDVSQRLSTHSNYNKKSSRETKDFPHHSPKK